jgi:large subunit ribosomal protein L6
MSRLIKKPISIPSGTTVTQSGGNFVFKGVKGELKMKAIPGIDVTIEDGKFWVKRGEGLTNEAMLGTFWSLAQNAIQGVAEGYAKTLEIEGVGYRAVVEGGKELVLYLGYALPVRRAVPEGIAIAVEKNTIKISGIDKDAVGRAAAEIRALKKPEPYKGKGIHYQGEIIRRKVGKKAGTTA